MNENESNINETVEEETTEEVTTEETGEDFANQIAKLKEELRKTKKDKDQASSEAAKYKKALRAKQTTEEKEAEELAEQRRLADEEKENMRKELEHMKAVAAYKSLQEETVEMMIEAVSDKDHQAIATILNNEIEKAVKEAIKAEKVKWLKENPPANVGTGDGTTTVTKEQFLKMGYKARCDFFEKHPDLYKKYTESEE